MLALGVTMWLALEPMQGLRTPESPWTPSPTPVVVNPTPGGGTPDPQGSTPDPQGGSPTPRRGGTPGVTPRFTPSPESLPTQEVWATPQPKAPAVQDDALTRELAGRFGSYQPLVAEGYGPTVINFPDLLKSGYVTVEADSEMFTWVKGMSSTKARSFGVAHAYKKQRIGKGAFGASAWERSLRGLIVEGHSAWRITVRPLTHLPRLTGPTQGAGNEVFVYSGPARRWRLTASGVGAPVALVHQGKETTPFTTKGNLRELIISTKEGTSIIDLRVIGDWKLAPA